MSQALKAKAAAKRIAIKTSSRRRSSRSDDPLRYIAVSKHAAAKPIIGSRVGKIPLHLCDLLPKDVADDAVQPAVTFDRLASIAKYFAGNKALAVAGIAFGRVSGTRGLSAPRPANWRHPQSASAPRPRPLVNPRLSLRWRRGRQREASARSSIFRLRQLLGLPVPGVDVQTATLAPEDAILVAFDTEFRRTGLTDRVTQLGVTTLDTRDIAGVVPGQRGPRWTMKMRTTQFVPKLTWFRTSTTKGLTDCLFTSDIRRTSPGSIKNEFLKLIGGTRNIRAPAFAQKSTEHLRADVGEPSVFSRPRHIVFIGHSIDNDFAMLRKDPYIQLDLLDTAQTGLPVATTFDTLDLAHLATEQGARIPSKKLGRLVPRLGVNPVFLRQHDPVNVKGTHNASNDSAYTMIALLLFALRWDRLTNIPMRYSAKRDRPLGLSLVDPSKSTKSSIGRRTTAMLSRLGRTLAAWSKRLL
ncbi:hypothetical protein B0A48_11847 [Cryoendolithus antarcticus]|uniref:Gfd2/YDR514C-like C-terminal domain-containing protein n=1 Tax=Cryoendolithus antarcticus TaxID=1507870 RepID=A0A1V8ST02_9PEZI|nr:hypothetical protein B0A48_11847 [Cryoendolithus antarcticus]